MYLQKVFFVFLVSFLFVPVCFAKRNKIQQYWKPSRFINSNSTPNFTNQASETNAVQRVIKSENQRIDRDPYLLQAVFHPSPRVAKSAILALGRIGDPYCVETLSRVLNGKNEGLKEAAAFSMGQIGDDLAIRLLSQHVAMERKTHIRGAFYRAMGYSRQIAALSILSRALETETDSSVLKNVTEGIGILMSGNSSDWIISENTLKKLAALSTVQNPNSVSAAFALSQYKGEAQKLPAADILSAATKTNNREVQTLLIRVLSRVDDSQVVTFLLSKLSSSNPVNVRVEAIKSLRGHKLTDLGLGIFEKTLADTNSHVTIAALETIDEQPINFSSFSETILRIFKNTNSLWVKATALKTLSRLVPEQGRSLALQALKTKETLLVSSALTSLVEINRREDWGQIQPFLKEGSPQIVSQAIEALGNLKPEEISDDLKGTLKGLIGKKDPGILALTAQLAAQKGWKDFADPLAEAYYSLSADDAVETRAALIASFTAIGSENQIPILNLALKDKSKQVVLAALEATKAITGKEIPFQVPRNSKTSDIVPDYNVWSSATSKKVILKTTRGDIEIKFYEDTPVTAFRFVELVNNHFYDGKSFHRVVPNFVSQGGDPRGDGFGGAGFLLRDEFSPRNHERGTLGIATSGKDTGGCQFFFNLLPNYHLNGRYTTFAEVVSGLDIMDKLEVGDKIVSAKIK